MVCPGVRLPRRGRPMAKLEHKVHPISLTHWDRERRFRFEETRMLLVEMMDGLLDLLERQDRYRHYHLDGRSILPEDYLQARPENRDRLTRHIRSGRILIGPWYTLPATSMVSGESLILRVADPTSRDIQAEITTAWPVSSVRAVLADEVTEAEGVEAGLDKAGRCIAVTVAKKKIVTLRLQTGP